MRGENMGWVVGLKTSKKLQKGGGRPLEKKKGRQESSGGKRK